MLSAVRTFFARMVRAEVAMASSESTTPNITAEDLNPGPAISGVTVVNPFVEVGGPRP